MSLSSFRVPLERFQFFCGRGSICREPIGPSARAPTLQLNVAAPSSAPKQCGATPSGYDFFETALIALFLALACSALAGGDASPAGQILAEDDFSGDLSRWVVEQTPSGKTRIIDGQLDIDDAPGPNDKGGCTVWYKEKFSGPIMIEYDAVMVQEGGPNDRCSDLNCFWMATDPKHPEDLFAGSAERAGNFKKYDPLRLYYVGYGANGNITTRFRRYPGDGTRPLEEGDDLTDAKFMNVPNKKVKIRLIADGKKIQFYRDGELIFDKTDPEPFTEGWFGFRTVRNHVRFDNFRVTRLPSP